MTPSRTLRRAGARSLHVSSWFSEGVEAKQARNREAMRQMHAHSDSQGLFQSSCRGSEGVHEVKRQNSTERTRICALQNLRHGRRHRWLQSRV